ncbi:MAG: hypothetical protein ABJ251_12080 [Paracoccaceae bacterium]
MRDFTHNTPRYVQIIWLDGVPVAVVDGQADEIFLIRMDHIGRPVFATDAINLRFPGQWFHAKPSLHQNWIRDCDPTSKVGCVISRTSPPRYVQIIWFDGVPVAVVDGQTDEIFLIRTDQIGRPVFATDANGVKIWKASYLPFGGAHVASTDAINLRFPRQWFHTSNGLHQNWIDITPKDNMRPLTGVRSPVLSAPGKRWEPISALM